MPDLGDRPGIKKLARLVNAYQELGGFSNCAEVVRLSERATLEDLQIELFLAYRAGNHLGDDSVVAVNEELYPQFLRILSLEN